MKHILFTKELLLSAVALFAIIATSCIREDLDQCYTLKLKVENIKGDDITEYGWMESTDLYIFDENLNYLEKRSLDKNFIRSRNEIVLDGYTADRSLRIVAWGNVNALGEKQSVIGGTDHRRLESDVEKPRWFGGYPGQPLLW